MEAKVFHITHEVIDLPNLLSNIHSPKSGALVLFSGEVRDINLEKEVLHIEYECFEAMAEKTIADILKVASEKWGLENVMCVHRVGKVNIEESAVCVITTHKHRKEAYEANQYIIGRVKHEVPIWKKEYFADGSQAWGNNCNCPDPNNHDWTK